MLESLIQCAHVIITFADVITVLCVSLPGLGEFLVSCCSHPGYQPEGAVLGAKGNSLHPLDAGEVFKSIFIVCEAVWGGSAFSVRNPSLANY